MRHNINSETQKDERAVSPVIGVILMVAITVILAAVIAAFVLDLGQSQSASPSAGITIDGDDSEVTFTLTSIDRGENFRAECGGSSIANGDLVDDGEFDGVGSTVTVEDLSGDCSDVPVSIVGEYQGSDGVIVTYDDHL